MERHILTEIAALRYTILPDTNTLEAIVIKQQHVYEQNIKRYQKHTNFNSKT